MILSNFLEAGGCLRWPYYKQTPWLIWQESRLSEVEAKTPNDIFCGVMPAELLGAGISNNHDEFSVFTSTFFLDQSEFTQPQQWAFASDEQMQSWLKKGQLLTPSNRVWQAPQQDLFRNSFQKIQEEITQGHLQKALPVVFTQSSNTLSKHELLAALLKMTELPKELIPYGSWKKGAGFLGATPEILFSTDSKQLKTMALAGTSALSRDSAEFLNDPKEMKEHQFVVSSLSEALKEFGPVEKGTTHVLSLPTLQHLATEISVLSSSLPKWEVLIHKMHPTSALGTYPKDRWKWLQELPEQSGRRSFGAPFGVKFSNEVQLAVVGIRQIQWDSAEIRIGAGCGLVKESIFEREWQEILLKINSVKKIFGWA